MTKQVVRVSKNDLEKMVRALDKFADFRSANENVMDVLIEYESAGGIGCLLQMVVDNVYINGIKSSVTVKLVTEDNW
jgi:predicted RNA-binding protein with PIN domain